MIVSWLLHFTATSKVYLRDGSTLKKKKKSRRTTTLRQRSHIKLAIKSSHSTLGSGQPVLALTLYRQAG